jgi:GH18 family chitinase
MVVSTLAAALALAPAPTVLAGYLPAWQMETYDLKRLAPLTDVLYFSVQPTAEGRLDLRDIRMEDLPKLAAAKRRYGFRLLLCCGGWERSAGFMATASVPERRSRFVAEVDLFLAKYGFDGIDLDWEHPKDATEGQAYGDLIQALRKTLAPKKRLVTAAIASWQPMSKDAVRGLDRVHLMSYDHPQRHATMDLAKSDVAKLRAMGFEGSKIVLGLPLYGRNLKNWNDAKPYADIRTLFTPEPGLDEAGDYYYNGPTTVEAKAKYTQDERLAGLMVWEVTQDAPGVDSLLERMRVALRLPVRP